MTGPSASDRVRTGLASTTGGDPAATSAALAARLEQLRAVADAWPAGTGLEVKTIGAVAAGGRSYPLPRIRITGDPAGQDPIPVALFAGLHGDEPAGCAALIELAFALVEQPERAAGYDLFLYPVVNPTGYEAGTRVNHLGRDLNREFWRGSDQPEVRCIEAELQARPFAGLITLHADDTCEGVYGYAHGRTLNEALLAPALAAASQHLPVDSRAVIDGFPARSGLICDCFAGVLSAPPEQRPQPFDVIMETPALAPFDRQVAAAVAALESILAAYPGFIAYAQGI